MWGGPGSGLEPEGRLGRQKVGAGSGGVKDGQGSPEMGWGARKPGEGEAPGPGNGPEMWKLGSSSRTTVVGSEGQRRERPSGTLDRSKRFPADGGGRRLRAGEAADGGSARGSCFFSPWEVDA